MNKNEFIDGLTRALSSTGSESLIRENREYYSSYIDEEIKKGRAEEEVLEELGEPRLIANSIKEAAGYEGFTGIDGEANTFESKKTYKDEAADKRFNNSYGRADSKDFGGRENYSERSSYRDNLKNTGKVFNISPLTLILVLVAGIVIIGAVFAAVFSIVGGILSFIAPVLGPILLIAAIMIFIRIFRS